MIRTLAVLAFWIIALPAFAKCTREPQTVLVERTTDALQRRAFQELDAAAELYRTKNQFSAAGNLTLNGFYDYLGSPEVDCDNPEHIAAVWAERDAALTAWTTASPSSSNAHIAHAAFMVKYAYLARGNGFSNTVTPEGRALFVTRMTQARTELEALDRSARKDPWWYRSMLDVGLAQGWPARTFDRLLDEGIKRHPRAYRLYQIGAEFHSARWYGSDEELNAYIERMVKLTKKTMGQGMYTKLRMHVEFDENFQERYKADWTRMKAGHESIIKEYPDKWNHVVFANAACIVEDIPVLKKQLELIGPDTDSDAWTKQREYCIARQNGPVECFRWEDTNELVCGPKAPN